MCVVPTRFTPFGVIWMFASTTRQRLTRTVRGQVDRVALVVGLERRKPGLFTVNAKPVASNWPLPFSGPMLPEFDCGAPEHVAVQEPIDVHVPGRNRIARLTRDASRSHAPSTAPQPWSPSDGPRCGCPSPSTTPASQRPPTSPLSPSAAASCSHCPDSRLHVLFQFTDAVSVNRWRGKIEVGRLHRVVREPGRRDRRPEREQTRRRTDVGTRRRTGAATARAGDRSGEDQPDRWQDVARRHWTARRVHRVAQPGDAKRVVPRDRPRSESAPHTRTDR